MRENYLLALLPPGERRHVIERCKRVALQPNTVLRHAREPIADVYFPLSGVVSLVGATTDGHSVEVAMIGNEGLVGSPLVLGATTSPNEVLAELPGEALAMPVEEFRNEPVGVVAVMRRYRQALTNQISQGVVCVSAHTVEQRLCRWLLMARDRAGTDQLRVTQETLSQLLGVHRTSITEACSLLEMKEVIRRARGKITVLDHGGLVNHACECYGVVSRELAQIGRPL